MKKTAKSSNISKAKTSQPYGGFRLEDGDKEKSDKLMEEFGYSQFSAFIRFLIRDKYKKTFCEHKCNQK